MCGCNSSISYQSKPAPVTLNYTPDPNCTFSQMDAYNTQLRLKCLENKVKKSVYNKYLGVVNSLINLQDYCRYDLQQIITVLEQNGC